MADLVIVTRPLPGSRDCNSAAVELVSDRRAAIAWAVSVAEPGDVVVIVGSQTAPRCAFDTQSDDLSDTEIARQLLYARNQAALRLAP